MLYMQRVNHHQQRKTFFAINSTHSVLSTSTTPSGKIALQLQPNAPVTTKEVPPLHPFDYVILATGTQRADHTALFSALKPILDSQDGKVSVDSGYRVNFKRGSVGPGVGVWVLDAFESAEENIFEFLALRSGKVGRSLKEAEREVDGKAKGKVLEASVL